MNLREDFIAFAVAQGVLKFGEFVTKAGRTSPYFFNAGLFNHGAALGQLAQFYAATLRAAALEFDMLFGPAYKGITLASATAVALVGHDAGDAQRSIPFAYNRKEAKAHGEGGSLIGAPLQGRVVIVDDVISAGTSVRESVQLITQQGATPCAVLIALDRMERADSVQHPGQLSPYSAVQEVSQQFGIPVVSIANLDDLLGYMAKQTDAQLRPYQQAIEAYRKRYGVVS